METTLYANENLRYRTEYDGGNHWQLEDFVPSEEFGIVEFGRGSRDYDFDLGEFRSELRELIARIDDRARQKKAVRLYLRMAGYQFVERRLVGYSQGDVRDVIVYGREKSEASLVEAAEIVKAWLYGDVFDIVEEKREAWRNVETAELEYRWAEAERFGGYVFVGDFTPEKAIADTFGITIGGDRVEAAR
jgi:hypothetical protein